uniref:Uncharacterized protein n=1 Tax=Oryza punctata TaxID=4537 RepID=A0A0E0KWA1_ORYPU
MLGSGALGAVLQDGQPPAARISDRPALGTNGAGDIDPDSVGCTVYLSIGRPGCGGAPARTGMRR